MLKRKRPDELPRRKRLQAASVSLLTREWVAKEVLSKDGVRRRPDGTFSFRMRKDCVLTRAQIDELIEAVRTDTEAAYVKFSTDDDGHLVVSVENEYPAKAALRREEREKEPDAWWRHLDLVEKKSETVMADEMWSCELEDISAFGRACLLTVNANPKLPDKFTLQVLRP